MAMRSYPAVLAWPLFCMLMIHPPATAAEDMTITTSIQVDGKPHLEGSGLYSGSLAAFSVDVWGNAWGCVAAMELKPVKGVEVPPDQADPLKATLKGRITIEWGELRIAETDQLHLVRRAADAVWIVAPADAERIAKEIRLAHAPQQPDSEALFKKNQEAFEQLVERHRQSQKDIDAATRSLRESESKPDEGFPIGTINRLFKLCVEHPVASLSGIAIVALLWWLVLRLQKRVRWMNKEISFGTHKPTATPPPVDPLQSKGT